MKLVRYPLPVLKELFIDNYDLYKCPVSISLSDNINIIFGANGLGKSTLLYIIQYAVIGPYTKGVKTRNYKGEQRTSRPTHDKDFFRARMIEQREDAAVTISFLVGSTSFIVKHSLYDNSLLSVSVDGKDLEGSSIKYSKYEELYYTPEKKSSAQSTDILSETLIKAYHDTLVQATGLPDIESLITMMTKCMFFTESRDFTFWDEDGELSSLIISKYFMDQEGYKKFVSAQQEVKHYDSQQRLKSYEISFIRKFLGEIPKSNKRSYTSDDLKHILDEIQEIEANVARARQRTSRYDKERIDIRMVIEETKNQIEILDSTWYRAVFPAPYKNSFERYSRAIMSGVCPFCENKGNFDIKASECFYCRHAIDVNYEANLNEVELEKRDLQHELRKHERSFEQIKRNLTAEKKSIDELERELSEKNRIKYDIESYLDKKPDENYLKLKKLEEDQKRLKGSYEQARNKTKELMKALDARMQEVFLDFSRAFVKYAASFFGSKSAINLELVGDKDDDRMFLFYLNNKRRERRETLSESQRIFVDFAFRLAVLEYFHTASFFMCETPDSTLDIMSESNAVGIFSSYAKAGNTLLLTANARNSELITKLIERHKNQCNIIDLFKLSSIAPVQTNMLADLTIAEYL